MASLIDKWLQIRCVTEGFSERIKTISTGSSRQTSRSGIGSALDAKPIEQGIIVMSWVGSYDFDSFHLETPGLSLQNPGDCPQVRFGDCPQVRLGNDRVELGGGGGFKRLRNPGTVPSKNSGTVPELDRETTAMK